MVGPSSHQQATSFWGFAVKSLYSLTKFRKKTSFLAVLKDPPAYESKSIDQFQSSFIHLVENHDFLVHKLLRNPEKTMAVLDHHPVPCILQVPCRSRVLRHAGNTQQLMLTEPTGTPMLQPPRDVWGFKVCWIF